MVDKTVVEKEALELNKIYDLYIDKRKEIMKNTQFRVKYIFGDAISEVSISPDKTNKHNNFLAKIKKVLVLVGR